MVSANSSARRSDGGRNLRDQSRRILRDVKDLGSIAVEDVGDGAERIKASGRAFLASGRASLTRYENKAKRYVAENPLKSLLVAVGVGALIGLALRRRS